VQASRSKQQGHLHCALLQQVMICVATATQRQQLKKRLRDHMHNPRLTSTKGSCISDSVKGPCASTTSNVVVSATTAADDSSHRLLLVPAASPLLTAGGLLPVLLVGAAAAGLLLLSPAEDLRQRLKKLPLLPLVVVLLGCLSVPWAGAASWPCCTWQVGQHARAESSRQGEQLWMRAQACCKQTTARQMCAG
jgi:hypothetical protein